jgi:hypothetical protein
VKSAPQQVQLVPDAWSALRSGSSSSVGGREVADNSEVFAQVLAA